MNEDIKHALGHLDATRAVLRRRLVGCEAAPGHGETPDPGAAEAARETSETMAGTSAGGPSWEGHARILFATLGEYWQSSPLRTTLDTARPVAARLIRDNPMLALSVALGSGALLGLSHTARLGALRLAGGVVRKSFDTAVVLGLLWQVYAQYSDAAAAAALAEEAPAEEV